MSAVTEFRWPPQDPKTELRPLLEHAPLGFAQFQHGTITALNPALERLLDDAAIIARSLTPAELISPQDRATGERLLREIYDRTRNSFQIDSAPLTAGSNPVRWTAWRVPASARDSESVLAMADAPSGNPPDDPETERRIRQAKKLEAVGRLAGGVAHDFNNLLTGVLLNCDLLLAYLEPHHRVRKYAEQIRGAGMQATGLVRQLLSVARPSNHEPRPLSLNEIAEGMSNLLLRLIGENIELKFKLDPNLGLVKMDPTQAQQILLNLVLNSRDAMPAGGEITVETRNCRMQILTDAASGDSRSSLPCVLFSVADNGSGMDASTRTHLFEPFFTTKARKGTGLGLATVHDIVSANGGLIHVDSAMAQGTRITVLLPLSPESAGQSQPIQASEKIEGELPAVEKENQP
jgi:two-component system, cell cycle sensor histidine kinase and response regulator CckA